MRTALNHLVKTKRVSSDQVGWFDLPAAPPPKDRWMNEAEEAVFLAAAAATSGSRLSRIHRFVAIALDTGARRSAILNLRWAQVDVNAGLIDFREGPVTKKRRVVVPIADRLMPVLERAHRERTGPFVLDHNGAVRTSFENLAQKSGFDWVTPHVLRHTWATLAARAGVDLWQIAGVLGDTLETVTRVYAHHSPDHLRNAVNRRRA